MRGLALLPVVAASAAWAQPPGPATAAATPTATASASAPAPVVPVLRLDDEAIRDAVKAAVAEMPKLPPPDAKPDFGASAAPGSASGAGGQAAIDRAFIAAEVGSCWGSDALKHNPPVIMVAGLPVVLGGLLALPHVFYAAASGKCK